MSGGYVATFKKLFRLRILLALLLNGITVIAVITALRIYTPFNDLVIAGTTVAILIVLAFIQAYFVSNELSKPTEYLADAIFHVSPNEHFVAAPNIDKLNFGHELVATLTRQIYDFAATSQVLNTSSQKDPQTDLLDALPVSIIGLDAEKNIALFNKTAETTFGLTNPVGVPLSRLLKMQFNNVSLDSWTEQVKNISINSLGSWNKVEVSSFDGAHRSYFDIAAVYRQKHPSGVETLLVFFNHNEQFESEANALNLIALSVHEIRTPLTILRGYIEVLRSELEGKVDEATKQYIDRLSASSENLAGFMANILNVAKVDQNQFKLNLVEASWEQQLVKIVKSLQTRANVRGKELSLAVTNGLPTVAVDVVSITEVINNLVDNAIKYSPPAAKNIYIEATVDNDGSVLTTVRDTGVGIPDTVVQNLFTRFYRNHRNKFQIAGSGLGLFISREIVTAHHGNIWVKSKEGAGTTVGFTLIPYTKLAEVEKTEDNGITKVPHGWIKNHSMQRR